MSKRLERIKKKEINVPINSEKLVDSFDYTWLISQAEQLQLAQAKIQKLEAELLATRSQREEEEKSLESLIYWVCQFPPKSDQMLKDVQTARRLLSGEKEKERDEPRI